MTEKLDYLHIRAWGHMLGSFRHFVEGQVRTARADGAPQDVIYLEHQPNVVGDPARFGDPERYFWTSDGRVWVRYDERPGLPESTAQQMSRSLENLRDHGSVFGPSSRA